MNIVEMRLNIIGKHITEAQQILRMRVILRRRLL